MANDRWMQDVPALEGEDFNEYVREELLRKDFLTDGEEAAVEFYFTAFAR